MRILVLSSALLFLVLVGLQFETAQSQCCSGFGRTLCDDYTPTTPCCGYRKCNLFCCACKGGCRRGPGKREVKDEDADSGSVQGSSEGGSEEDDDPISKYDADGDGRINLPEARRWLIAGGCGNPIVKVMALTSEFDNLDTDKDGTLDRDEIGG